MPKFSASTLIIHQYLKRYPITDAKKIAERCNIALPTANKSLHYLIDLGVVKEITGKVRNKIYVYENDMNILNEGEEPIK